METHGGRSEESKQTPASSALCAYTIVGKHNWGQSVCLMIHRDIGDNSPLDIEDPDNSIILGFNSPSKFPN